MRKNTVLWSVAAVVACLYGYIGVASTMMDLGAVMHDLHCPDHGSFR